MRPRLLYAFRSIWRNLCKFIAPCKGFSGYQALLKLYISDDLSRDEAQFAFSKQARKLG